jgi:parallel beta-helix repeat protein
MKKVIFISSIFLFVLLSIGCASAESNVLYVDNNLGNDLNDGSQAHPWKTINHAALEASQGDTVLIANGTYHPTENIHITSSGTQSDPITFIGQGKVVIDGSGLDGSIYSKRDAIFIENSDYILIKNLEIKNAYRAGIRVSGSDHVTINNVVSHDNGNWGIFTDFSNHILIEKCECYGSKNEHGIYVSNSGDYPTIRGNIIHDNHSCGLHMNGDISMGGDGVISQALVENNIIYNNGVGGGSGINCDGVTNSIIRNNLIYNNHASGISLYCIDGGAPSVNNQIYDNTVIVASDGRWALNLKDGSSKNMIYNNILLNKNPSHGSINTDSIDGLKCDYNILSTGPHPITPDDDTSYPSFSQWQTMGFDQNSTQATPEQIFISPSDNVYNLKENSTAVDKGTSQYNCSIDILGNNRPNGNGYDIGAYEYYPLIDIIPPKILTTDPTDNAVNIPYSKTIKITFNETIVAGKNFWIELKNRNGTQIPFNKSINGTILMITPISNLSESSYSLSIHTGAVTDLEGNPVAGRSIHFSVGTPPKVSSTNPTNLKTGFSRTGKISIKFSENIYSSTYYTKITVKNLTTGNTTIISKSISGSILYIKNNSKRSANTWYQVTIPAGAVKDKAGNKLTKAYTFKFRTGSS